MATFNFNKVNLAAAQISSAITASQTSITINASESELFPTVPFFATIMPAGGVPNTLNSEIVQVTAVNTPTGALTITRAQRGTTAKAQDEGAVIMNGVYIEDLAQTQAIGKSFFPATLSSNVYYIQDARLTTAPENGDSIRVVFSSDWTSGTPKLSLNSGTSYNIYAGGNLTATHGTTNTPAMVKSGIIYELTYYNGAWYILNLTANSSITSDNVDWATISGQTLSDLMAGIVKTIYWTGPYACVSKIERIGNLVIYDMYATPSSFPSHGESQEVIPVGYRPSDYTHCVFRSSFNQAGLWQINPSGTVSWWMGTANPGDIQAHCAYRTNDAYPS